jgi:hypothetical protein
MRILSKIDLFESLFPILRCFAHMTKFNFVGGMLGHVHVPATQH